jgi:hypothetical protein
MLAAAIDRWAPARYEMRAEGSVTCLSAVAPAVPAEPLESPEPIELAADGEPFTIQTGHTETTVALPA